MQVHKDRVIQWMVPSFCLLALAFSLDLFGIHQDYPFVFFFFFTSIWFMSCFHLCCRNAYEQASIHSELHMRHCWSCWSAIYCSVSAGWTSITFFFFDMAICICDTAQTSTFSMSTGWCLWLQEASVGHGMVGDACAHGLPSNRLQHLASFHPGVLLEGASEQSRE